MKAITVSGVFSLRNGTGSKCGIFVTLFTKGLFDVRHYLWQESLGDNSGVTSSLGLWLLWSHLDTEFRAILDQFQAKTSQNK